MADTRLLLALVVSLLISSIGIAFVTDESMATLGEFSLYKPVNVDLTDNTSRLDYDIDKVSMGYWERDTAGLTSKTDGKNIVYFLTRWPKNAIYDNEYGIHNPDGRKYIILARETNYFGDSIEVVVKPQGVTVRSAPFWDGVTDPGYQIFLPVNLDNDYRIRTVLDEPARELSVYINGNLIGIAENIPEDSVLSLGVNRYGGICVEGSGFSLTSFGSTGQTIETESFDIWTFLASLSEIMAWYTSSGVPVVDIFVNFLIKIQQFGIFLVAVTIVRGN